jgi:hypothetical protein
MKDGTWDIEERLKRREATRECEEYKRKGYMRNN